MLLKPLPLLVQVCADQFALRRVARVTQAAVVLGVASYWVDWTPAKVGLTVVMLVSGSVIFLSIFVLFGVRPVLDRRRQRGGQRVHLRRQHDDAVPADRLPQARWSPR